MKVSVLRNNMDAAVIAIEGEFDALSAPVIRSEFDTVVGSGGVGVIVDLSGVTFMDSSGAGALVFLHKRLARQARTLELVGVTGQPLILLDLLRITKVIPVNQTLALRSAQVEGDVPGAEG